MTTPGFARAERAYMEPPEERDDDREQTRDDAESEAADVARKERGLDD